MTNIATKELPNAVTNDTDIARFRTETERRLLRGYGQSENYYERRSLQHLGDGSYIVKIPRQD